MAEVLDGPPFSILKEGSVKDRKIWVILNIVTLIAALVMNFLAVSLPLNDMTTREISNSFDAYFIPAGYVFSIWSLIYIGLIAFSIYQALPAQRTNQRLAQVDVWVFISNIANAFWLVSFHYRQFVLSLLIMLVLLISLVNIFEKLEIGKKRAKPVWKWTVEVPYSIYMGWITVATVSNFTQVLVYLNWDGLLISSETWFVLLSLAVVFISALMNLRRRAFEFSLVLAWAFVGIAVKFPTVALVRYTAWGSAIAVCVIAMLAFALDLADWKEK